MYYFDNRSMSRNLSSLKNLKNLNQRKSKLKRNKKWKRLKMNFKLRKRKKFHHRMMQWETCWYLKAFEIVLLLSLAEQHIGSMPSYCIFMQGLNEEVNPRAAELEESNALALAIIQPGNGYR